MTCDELVGGIAVTVFAPTFGERVLLVPFEHLETPDVSQITSPGSGYSERQFTPSGWNWKTSELTLDAHIGSSIVDAACRAKLERAAEMITTGGRGAIKLALSTLNSNRRRGYGIYRSKRGDAERGS